jgi:hypothetical protein
MGINEFRCMAFKIVELFPNEEMDTYFFPPTGSQKRLTGKLADKHYNFVRKIKALLKQIKQECSSENTD